VSSYFKKHGSFSTGSRNLHLVNLITEILRSSLISWIVKRIKLDKQAIIYSLDGSWCLHDEKEHAAKVTGIVVLSGQNIQKPLLVGENVSKAAETPGKC